MKNQIQTQKITKNSIISDILVQNHEKARELVEVMMDFGIHCISCGAAAFETLEQGVLGHGYSEEELDKLIEVLNKIISAKEKQNENQVQEFKLNFTEKAIQKIKEIIKKEKKENSILRISVVGGGCSGFMYDLEVVNEKNPQDLNFKNKGINISVDKNSLEYLNGTEIDFIDALKESGFKFNNPNATKSCGCGKSFR